MKTLVTYVSRTGNTKKVAEAVFNAVPGSKEIKEIKQIDSLDGYDLIFIGFPIESYKPAKEAANLIEKHATGKSIALFITHSAPENMPEVQAWINNCKAVAVQSKIKGIYNCQGELGEQIANYMLNSKNEALVAWAKMRDTTLGKPDAERIERAQLWAKKVVGT